MAYVRGATYDFTKNKWVQPEAATAGGATPAAGGDPATPTPPAPFNVNTYQEGLMGKLSPDTANNIYKPVYDYTDKNMKREQNESVRRASEFAESRGTFRGGGLDTAVGRSLENIGLAYGSTIAELEGQRIGQAQAGAQAGSQIAGQYADRQRQDRTQSYDEGFRTAELMGRTQSYNDDGTLKEDEDGNAVYDQIYTARTQKEQDELRRRDQEQRDADLYGAGVIYNKDGTPAKDENGVVMTRETLNSQIQNGQLSLEKIVQLGQLDMARAMTLFEIQSGNASITGLMGTIPQAKIDEFMPLFGLSTGDQGFDPALDLDGDGIIGMSDLIAFAEENGGGLPTIQMQQLVEDGRQFDNQLGEATRSAKADEQARNDDMYGGSILLDKDGDPLIDPDTKQPYRQETLDAKIRGGELALNEVVALGQLDIQRAVTLFEIQSGNAAITGLMGTIPTEKINEFMPLFGLSEGEAGYNPEFDYDLDGIIGMNDLIQFAESNGGSLPTIQMNQLIEDGRQFDGQLAEATRSAKADEQARDEELYGGGILYKENGDPFLDPATGEPMRTETLDARIQEGQLDLTTVVEMQQLDMQRATTLFEIQAGTAELTGLMSTISQASIDSFMVYFGAKKGEANYSEGLDVDDDGIIGMTDFIDYAQKNGGSIPTMEMQKLVEDGRQFDKQLEEANRSAKAKEDLANTEITGVVKAEIVGFQDFVSSMGLASFGRAEIIRKGKEAGYGYDASTEEFYKTNHTLSKQEFDFEKWATEFDLTGEAKDELGNTITSREGLNDAMDRAVKSASITGNFTNPEGEFYDDETKKMVKATVHSLAAKQLMLEATGQVQTGVDAKGDPIFEDTVSKTLAEHKIDLENGEQRLRTIAQTYDIRFTEADILGFYNEDAVGFARFQDAIGKSEGEAGWNKDYDYDNDGIIDEEDFIQYGNVMGVSGAAITTIKGKEQAQNHLQDKFNNEMAKIGLFGYELDADKKKVYSMDGSILTGSYDGNLTPEEAQRRFNNEMTEFQLFGGAPPEMYTVADFDAQVTAGLTSADVSFNANYDLNLDGRIDAEDRELLDEEVAKAQSGQSSRFEILSGDPGDLSSLRLMYSPPGPVTLAAQELGIEEYKIRETLVQNKDKMDQDWATFQSDLLGIIVDEDGIQQMGKWYVEELDSDGNPTGDMVLKDTSAMTSIEKDQYERAMAKVDDYEKKTVLSLTSSLGLGNNLTNEQKFALAQTILSIQMGSTEGFSLSAPQRPPGEDGAGAQDTWTNLGLLLQGFQQPGFETGLDPADGGPGPGGWTDENFANNWMAPTKVGGVNSLDAGTISGLGLNEYVGKRGFSGVVKELDIGKYGENVFVGVRNGEEVRFSTTLKSNGSLDSTHVIRTTRKGFVTKQLDGKVMNNGVTVLGSDIFKEGLTYAAISTLMDMALNGPSMNTIGGLAKTVQDSVTTALVRTLAKNGNKGAALVTFAINAYASHLTSKGTDEEKRLLKAIKDGTVVGFSNEQIIKWRDDVVGAVSPEGTKAWTVPGELGWYAVGGSDMLDLEIAERGFALAGENGHTEALMRIKEYLTGGLRGDGATPLIERTAVTLITREYLRNGSIDDVVNALSGIKVAKFPRIDGELLRGRAYLQENEIQMDDFYPKFNSVEGSAEYDPGYDANGDGIINYPDFVALVAKPNSKNKRPDNTVLVNGSFLTEADIRSGDLTDEQLINAFYEDPDLSDDMKVLIGDVLSERGNVEEDWVIEANTPSTKPILSGAGGTEGLIGDAIMTLSPDVIEEVGGWINKNSYIIEDQSKIDMLLGDIGGFAKAVTSGTVDAFFAGSPPVAELPVEEPPVTTPPVEEPPLTGVEPGDDEPIPDTWSPTQYSDSLQSIAEQFGVSKSDVGAQIIDYFNGNIPSSVMPEIIADPAGWWVANISQPEPEPIGPDYIFTASDKSSFLGWMGTQRNGQGFTGAQWTEYQNDPNAFIHSMGWSP